MRFHSRAFKPSLLVAASLSALLAIGASAPPPAPPAAPQRDLAQIARERIQVADDACDVAARWIALGQPSGTLLEWKRRQAQAHMDAPEAKADRLAFLEAYVRWLNENEQRMERLRKTGAEAGPLDISTAKYYRLEGEMWLTKAREQ